MKRQGKRDGGRKYIVEFRMSGYEHGNYVGVLRV